MDKKVTSPGRIYFISDVHLGLYPSEQSAQREKVLVGWLDEIKRDATQLYLVGDIFDFWHEYKHVVPKGYTRFLGKLAEMADMGIQLHYFTGNHDVWVYDYLPAEMGVIVHREAIISDLGGKRFYIGHGDAVGPGDRGYKILKGFFTNKILQWLFARIHPNAALAFGKLWSKNSRYAKGIVAEPYHGDDKEFQVIFARETLKKEHVDYFIFGHRHIPFMIQIGESSYAVNLGDWINNFTYAVWDGRELLLKSILPEREKEILRKKID
jgi:UDP-2,3-diacylglucosamine hydrolase